MIDINELRITPDNKCLIIDTSIQDLFYYEGVTIDSIIMDTSETFLVTGPSSTAITLYSLDMKELNIIQDNSGRHVRLEVTKPFINLEINDIYFVYIIANIENAPNVAQVPCNCSNNIVLSTVVNTRLLYKHLMYGIREIENTCEIPKNFIDKYLRLQVVLTAIKTGNYELAIKYWNKFFKNNPINNPIKDCGCNGRIR